METKFKETEIGRIPEEWGIRPAEKLCVRVTDGTHDTPKPVDEGYFLVTSKNLKNGNLTFEDCYRISEQDFQEVNRRSKVEQYDVIYGMIGTIGNPVMITQECVDFAVKNVGLFKTGGDKELGTWLVHYLYSKNALDFVERQKNGTSQNFAPLGLLRKFPIPTPPDDEIKRINEILSTVDDTIEKTDAVIKETQQLKKGLMQKLFTKGIGHTRFKETKVGRIPEEWEVKKLVDVLVLQRGFDLPVQNRVAGEYPILASNGAIDYHHEYKVKGPGIVTGRSGTLGKVHYIKNDYWPLNTTLYVKEIHDNFPKFLYYFLQSLKIERYGTGTGVPTLNRNVVHKVKVAVPPPYEQDKIASILSEVDTKIETEQAYKAELGRLKKGLMQVLLTGRIRVKV